MMLSGVWFCRGRRTQQWFVESTTMWILTNSAREVPLLYRHSYRSRSVLHLPSELLPNHSTVILPTIAHSSCVSCLLWSQGVSSSYHVSTGCCYIIEPECYRVHRVHPFGALLLLSSYSCDWMHAILSGGDWLYNWGILCGSIICTVCWLSVRSDSENDDWLCGL